MSKHTATRWVIDPENDRKVICEADSSFVADCNGLADESCDTANAAFIVRACNNHARLVEALEALIAEYEPNLKAFATDAPRKAKWQAALAALAAAKEEA